MIMYDGLGRVLRNWNMASDTAMIELTRLYTII